LSHVIVGAGAVGMGVGSALLAAGEPVTFVARAETARALRSEGCQRTGIFGSAHHAAGSFEVVSAVGALSAPARSILVATKAFATGSVARDLAANAALAASDAPVVSLQNGLGNAEELAARLEPRRIFSATILIGFRRTGPSRVDVTVCAKPIQMGSLFAAPLASLAPLVEAIDRGGIPAQTNPDIGRELWEKALYNCALNPLGALLGVPYGELASQPETRRIMEAVIAEIFAVLRASGERMPWQSAEDYLAHFYDVLLPPTREHESSMLQDLRAGRRTEIDSLCGEIVRRGGELGLSTPVNRSLLELVRATERDDAGRDPTS
jgi:2-dehydropantoate 2-reductase